MQSDYTPAQSVKPGFHRAANGGHGVVWWDPHVLELEIESKGGIRQQELLVEGDGETAQIGATDYEHWVRRGEETRRQGSESTEIVRSATHAAELFLYASGESDVLLLHSDVNRQGRPGGNRFGF